MESERRQLLGNIANNQSLLRDTEDHTLELLQKSQGHILDDQDLVDTLRRSKGMSDEIKARMQQSEEAEKQLNQARLKYLPVSITVISFLQDEGNFVITVGGHQRRCVVFRLG